MRSAEDAIDEHMLLKVEYWLFECRLLDGNYCYCVSFCVRNITKQYTVSRDRVFIAGWKYNSSVSQRTRSVPRRRGIVWRWNQRRRSVTCRYLLYAWLSLWLVLIVISPFNTASTWLSLQKTSYSDALLTICMTWLPTSTLFHLDLHFAVTLF